jgi:hypothetical protein
MHQRRTYIGHWRLALLIVTACLISHEARAIRVSVRGAATLEGSVRTDGDAQLIRGQLRDDLGAPIGGAHVVVDVLAPDGKPVLELPSPLPCGNSGGPLGPRRSLDAYVLDTDAQGVFCARAQQFPRRGVLRARFGGKPGMAGVGAEVAFDAEHVATSLSWDPRPDRVDLDLPASRVAVVLAGRPGVERGAEGVTLLLLDEKSREVGRAVTDDRGRASFDVVTARLSGPGQSEIEVRAADVALGVTPLRAALLRTSRVNLVGSGPAEAIVPRDGHRFVVAVETARGPVKTGAVEARIGSEVVGVGAVREGRAQVVTTFDVPAEGQLDVSFIYLPASPELRAGEALTLRVPVKPPPLWRKAPQVLLALGLLVWLARGWRRPARAQRSEPRAPVAEARPLPEFTVEPLAQGEDGWRGAVLDAHERRPIVGAVVSVVARDFYGERREIEQTVGEDGAFFFQTSWDPMRVLLIESPLHVKVERPLPRPGRVSVALVSRRRALLERMMAAARRLGLWSGGGPEPTPGQIARGFEAREREAEARWARGVEGAVYGPGVVGEEQEARVVQLEQDIARREPGDWVRR